MACIFPTVNSSEFHMERYRDPDHWEDTSNFRIINFKIVKADITNDIIGANFVGHVIKQVDEVNQFADDEDPVLSITTMVPLGKQSWIGDLKKFLSKKTSEDSTAQNALSHFFSSNRNGLFVNTRYLNFPARAEGLLSLLEDLNQAEKKKHKSNWNFEKILMVIPRLHPKDSNEEDKEITYRHQVALSIGQF